MRRYDSLPLIALLATPALAGPGQSLTQICEATDGTYGCNKNFDIPYGAEPITTCFDTTPCGVQILTTSDNICDLINDVMPDSNFVDGYIAWCIKAPEAIKEVKTYSSVWSQGRLRGADPSALFSAVDIEDEFRNRGFTFKSNKPAVVAKEFSNKDGWVVLKAQEISTKSYYDLLLAIDACGSTRCTTAAQDEAINNWFIKWITTAHEVRKGKLDTILISWEKAFDTRYKTHISSIKSGSNTVQSRHTSVSTKIANVKKSVCAKNACTGKTAAGHHKKISDALKTIKALSNIAAASNTAEEKRTYILWNYLGNIQAAYNLPPSILAHTYYNDLWDEGHLDNIRGLMHGFGTVTSELNMYANDIKTNLGPLIHLTKHESRVRTALNQVNVILAVNWKNNKELSKTAASRKVRDGFIQIQAILKKDMQGPLTNLIKMIDAFNKDFLTFPLRGNKMEFATGAVPYDRWFDLEFPYPCREDQTKIFKAGGFSKSHTWPEFSPCYFTSQRVELPKYWMPYLKFRYVKD